VKTTRGPSLLLILRKLDFLLYKTFYKLIGKMLGIRRSRLYEPYVEVKVYSLS
jgi:hypothetical protein